MKIFKYIILPVLMLACIFSKPTFARGNINIVLDGKKIESDVEPYIKNGRTMVPVRFIAEALGGTAEPMKNEGFPKEYEKFISILDKRYEDPMGIDLFIGKKVCLSDEAVYKADVAPEIKNGRTMVSLRFIADYLRFNVKWDNATRTVYLSEMTRDEMANPEKDNFNKWYYEKGSEAMEKCIENGFTLKNLNEVFK